MIGIWPKDLTHTPSLFIEQDRVSPDLVHSGSKAFTAAHLEADDVVVEVVEHAQPADGIYPYEFHGLGLDDVVLVVTEPLNTNSRVLAAIHLALQNTVAARIQTKAELQDE